FSAKTKAIKYEINSIFSSVIVFFFWGVTSIAPQNRLQTRDASKNFSIFTQCLKSRRISTNFATTKAGLSTAEKGGLFKLKYLMSKRSLSTNFSSKSRYG